MKTAVLVDVGKIVIEEKPSPKLEPHKILVRVKYCGICTLEQRLYRGALKLYYPIVPGHEVSGEVAAVGPKAGTAFKPGDHVALDMVFRCNVCYHCRTGQSNLCENRFNRSVVPLGGFSDYVLARPSQMHLLAEDIPLEAAAFTEPLACCIRSLKKIKVDLAEDVLIAGGGTMGMLHLQLARAMGTRVFISDINPERLEAALELGADGVFNPDEEDMEEEIWRMTQGRGVDACVVTSPALPALRDAFGLVKKGGRINIYTAYMGEPPELPIDLNTLHRSEILVTGTEGRTEVDFQQAARLISHGRIRTRPLMSKVVGFNEISLGIEAAMIPHNQRVLLGTEK